MAVVLVNRKQSEMRRRKPLKVSWIFLTHNRKKAAFTSLAHNLVKADYPIHELIHVDNGSDDEDFCNSFAKTFKPSVQIRHHQNLGVPKGYNRGYLNATGTHVLITGMDRMLPPSWLKDIWFYFKKIPNTGVISIYTPSLRPDELYSETRYFGEPELELNGLRIQPAIPFEARICSREFFNKVGFLHEEFDTYGYEDNEWGMRAMRVAKENGYINYVIPNLNAEHLKEDEDFIMKDGRTYRSFKDSFLEKNKIKFEEIRNQGFPYYNPFF